MNSALAWVQRRGPYVLLAGLLLALPEASWLWAAESTIDVARLGILTSASVVAVPVAVLAVEGLYCCARRLSHRWTPLMVALVSLPLVVSATTSLFSGEAIQRASGASFLRFGFGLALFATTYGAAMFVPALGVLKNSLLSMNLSLIVGHSDLLGHHLL
jgi:hypothetical protein